MFCFLSQSPHDPYKPANNALSCHDSLCTFLQHPPNYPCHNPSDQCDYEIEYADHGSSIGVLVKDFFRLQVLNGSVARVSLAFGFVLLFVVLNYNLNIHTMHDATSQYVK